MRAGAKDSAPASTTFRSNDERGSGGDSEPTWPVGHVVGDGRVVQVGVREVRHTPPGGCASAHDRVSQSRASCRSGRKGGGGDVDLVLEQEALGPLDEGRGARAGAVVGAGPRRAVERTALRGGAVPPQVVRQRSDRLVGQIRPSTRRYANAIVPLPPAGGESRRNGRHSR